MTTTYPRSKKEIDDEIKAMRKRHKEIIKTKESALAFLVRAGIATKSGKLAKRYRID